MASEQQPHELSAERIEVELTTIAKMSHEDMARLWRFAPSGHPYFNTSLPLYVAFEKRFRELGGWTPELSKRIGR